MSCAHAHIRPVVDATIQSRSYEVHVCLDCGRLLNPAGSGEMSGAEIVSMFADLALLVGGVYDALDTLNGEATVLKEAFDENIG